MSPPPAGGAPQNQTPAHPSDAAARGRDAGRNVHITPQLPSRRAARSLRASRAPGVGAWLPLFAFVVLFGLSMDYTVLVMVAVFAVFATLPTLDFKQLGVGLAAAIALDATIVRGIALPAVLTLLGDRGLRPAQAGARESRARRAGDWDHRRHALETGHE